MDNILIILCILLIANLVISSITLYKNNKKNEGYFDVFRQEIQEEESPIVPDMLS